MADVAIGALPGAGSQRVVAPAVRVGEAADGNGSGTAHGSGTATAADAAIAADTAIAAGTAHGSGTVIAADTTMAVDTASVTGAESGTVAPASPSCTAAQLRRFIKSRPYVPMHELRRRFELNGLADDVTPVRLSDGIVYVGLPARESQFIADLARQGDIGLELCHDPVVPIVVGVYAMRPVSR